MGLLQGSDGAVIANDVRTAERPLDRARGLLGTRALDVGQGLLIPRAKQIHTIGMQFAIDVVFLDRDLIVLHVVFGMKPWRITRPVWRARCVVELKAGWAEAVTIGDSLCYFDRAG